MVDHHSDKPDVYMKDLSKKFHFLLLRENLKELEVDSAHIHFENLREFAVETLNKNGLIYQYELNPQICLTPIKNDKNKMRDFAGETLVKNGYDQIIKDPENIYELRDFAADTLTKNVSDEILAHPDIVCETKDFAAENQAKNGTVANLPDTVLTNRDAILKELENMCILRDFAVKTLPKNGIESDFTTDTLSDPNLKSPFLKPENMAIFDPNSNETGILTFFKQFSFF